MGFQAEYIPNPFTLVAAATLSAGDPITPAGAKGASAVNFAGIVLSDCVSGDYVPVAGVGSIVQVQIKSGSSGVAKNDRVVYLTSGYEVAAAGDTGIGLALDAGAATEFIRILLTPVAATPAAAGAALTAADGSTVDGTYGAEEAAVLANNVVRIGEIEARLIAHGLIAAP